jgi:hypothetical protein
MSLLLRFHYIIAAAKKGLLLVESDDIVVMQACERVFFAEYAAGFFAPAHTFAIKDPFEATIFYSRNLNLNF